MIFDWGRTNPAAFQGSMGKSGNQPAPSFNAISSDVSSLTCPHYLNPDKSKPPAVPLNDGPISEDDVVIAVMGPTGAGKSSFVNIVAGSEEAVVGHGLKSQTADVRAVRCQHPDGRNVVLVDTPGFDDTYISDSEILKTIASWLKDTYKSNIKLAGLLYLHRISDVRMAGTPLRNLAVFRDLCGSGNLRNVVLVTTMWDELEDESLGYEREEELLSGFWKGMISLGSRTHRFECRTPESAWEIIALFDLRRLRSTRPKLAPLQIQKEMVDSGLSFQETAAAKTLLQSLTGEFRKAWAKLRGLRRSASSARPAGNRLWHFLSRKPPTTSSPESHSSERSLSSVSLFTDTDTSSIASRDSESSVAGSTSSGCSANGRRNSLLPQTIKCLRLAYGVAGITSIPAVQGSVATALDIAQLIEGMGGMHHVISQVLESSGWLLEEIAQYAAKSTLPADMEKTLGFFRRELGVLQTVVKNISSRNPAGPFFLLDSDIKVITTCIASIKQLYDMPEVKPTKDNRRIISRLEDRVTALRNNQALRKCECGIMSVVHEDRE